MHRLTAALALVAGAARADGPQPELFDAGLLARPVRTMTLDVDGDGAAERAALAVAVDGTVALEAGGRVAPDIAWSGGEPGQEASLARGPDGALWVVSGNEAAGRDRWHMALRLGLAGGRLAVVGLGYEFWDSLAEDNWGGCDLDLVSGRGRIEDILGARDLEGPGDGAVPIEDWRASGFDVWAACGLAWRG